MKVIIMRGVSGAGKTTYIRQVLLSGKDFVTVCSADHLFDRHKMKFSAELWEQAHKECLRKFLSLMLSETLPSVVVVDNTSIHTNEIAPYVAIAKAYDHEPEIITIDCDPVLAAERNVHGCPRDKVIAQVMHLDRETKRIPPFWKHTIIHANDYSVIRKNW